MLDYGFIKSTAVRAGFSLCGIAPVHPLESQRDNLCEWLRKGYGSSLSYMESSIDIRTDPSLLLEGAKTIVICAINYKNDASLSQTAGKTNKIASYALVNDYHITVGKMLGRMAGELASEYPGLRSSFFTDSGPVFEKSWAVEAGLGRIGRNSLLITPEYGSFVILGDLILDMEADRYDSPHRDSSCGNCRKCEASCPTGAITRKGIDTRLCISRMTIEKEADDEDRRKLLSGWIFGCDICQQCCPSNRKTPLAAHNDFIPERTPQEICETILICRTEEEFKAVFKNSPLSRAPMSRLRELIAHNKETI